MAGVDLERNLAAICEELDLEPVIRHLRETKLFTNETFNRLRNRSFYASKEAQNEALIDACKTDAQVTAFLEALRRTKQTKIVELLDPSREELAAGSEAGAEAGSLTGPQDFAHLRLDPDDEDPNDDKVSLHPLSIRPNQP